MVIWWVTLANRLHAAHSIAVHAGDEVEAKQQAIREYVQWMHFLAPELILDVCTSLEVMRVEVPETTGDEDYFYDRLVEYLPN